MLLSIHKARLPFILTLLFCVLITTQLHGQLQNIKFNHLTHEHGLSQSSGHAILQDSKGYMWFGTSDGLNRYNGYEMTVFKHNPVDSTTISGNNISYLYEDHHNNLWVGTTGAGLNLFDRDTETFTSFRVNYQDMGDGISSNSVSQILEDQGGRLWVATDYGLNLLNRDTYTFTHYFADADDPGSISNNATRSLLEDSRGNFWIGTQNGLNLFDRETNTFRSFRHDENNPNSLSSNSISAITEDADGMLWIGTTRGLNRFDPKTGSFTQYLRNDDVPYNISGNSVISILEDSRGVLWIGTENNGLNIFNREENRFYHHKHELDNSNSLSNNAVYALYENNDQILFVGTYSGGINYLDRKDAKFEHFAYDSNAEYPLSINSVTSFLEDSGGNFWVGTDGGGLNRFNRETGQFHSMRHEPGNENSLSSDIVLALLEDWNGYIWIGYYNGGLSRYDHQNNRFIHFSHNPDDPGSLCQDDIFTLFQDWNGTLWAGSNGRGVCSYDPDSGRFTRYQAEEGVIRDILQDSFGLFWLGTYGGGLKLLDLENGEPWNFYEGNNGLHSNVVLVLHEDQANNFWLGTAEGGLHMLDREQLLFNEYDVDNPIFTSYSMADGLPSNIVKGILEDDNGNLWLSTNNGLSKFDPKSGLFTNFSIEDGLQGEEFNTLAYYKDRSGFMYFGGISGFNRFHPDSVQARTFVHPVVFTDFKIFNRSVEIGEDSPLSRHISQTQHIELPYTATVLTFDYAALNFNSLKGMRYAYKMDGFDSEWNYVENRRTATYTNLNPGTYTFRVKTANSDGIWNEEEAELTLVIIPPFWQTTWFYVLSALCIGLLIATVYRIRIRAIRARNLQLEREIAERTEELKTKHRDLKKAMGELEATKDELVENAHKAGMADIATGVLHNVGNLLNSVNTSASLIESSVKQSNLKKLEQANTLLKEHIDNFDEYLATNPNGKNLLHYYLMLEEPLKSEQNNVLHQTLRLIDKIKLINEVIAAQQTYAGASMHADQTSIAEMIDNALALQTGSIERHGLTVEKDLQPTDPIITQRSKLIHTLVNIIKNAKEAMENITDGEKKLTIKTWQDESNVYISVADNGSGIKKEHLSKIFTQGFTTKKNGHGFGLHSCANYITEMGGSIDVKSDGAGKGAAFTITFNKIEPSDKQL